MKAVLVLVAFAACDGAQATPDAQPDASPRPPCTGAAPLETARCTNGSARTWVGLEGIPGSTSSMCSTTLQQSDAACANGCAVTGTVMLSYGTLPMLYSAQQVSLFGFTAAVLCAETPEPRVGDACTTDGHQPCLPTRAQLNADGTVAGQMYLTCSDGTCAAAAAPVVASYLQACDSSVLANYGTTGVNGAWVPYDFQNACLLAWDDATQSITSGHTRSCIGDWQCPAGSLCDDQIAPLGSTVKVPVCKPGPRGVLTPAMLSH